MSDRPQYPSYPGDDEPDRTQRDPRGDDGAQPAWGQQPAGPAQDPPAYGQAPSPAYGQAQPGYPPPYQPYGAPGQGHPQQGYSPQGYPQQGYGYGYAPQRPRTSTKAVLALVLGIVSIVFCYLGLLIGPVAIVLAVLARKEVAAAPTGSVEGSGMAIAGLVTGIAGTVIWAAVIALVVAVSV